MSHYVQFILYVDFFFFFFRFGLFLKVNFYHSKNAVLFHPNFGSNMDKPSHWVIFLMTFLTQRLGMSIF